MIRYFPLLETRTVLRTMLSAGVLAVLLLACAGTAAGATTWVVADDGGASSLIRGGGRLADNHAQKGLYTTVTPKLPDRRQA
jgi:hypothetical protein